MTAKIGAIFRYRCTSCDEVHLGFPAMTWKGPGNYLAMSEDERAVRCKLTENLCTIDDEEFYARCVIEYPVVGTNEIMGWGVWGSLSRTNFDLYRQSRGGETGEPVGPFFSWLSNRLPAPYPDTLNLKCLMHVRADGRRPSLELEPTDHPLAVEQRDGIAFERALDLVRPFLASYTID